MAVRIYSLAKELKIDSKELVELCTKAGLSGKSSPLASLADDEVVRLKEFLSHRGSRPAGGGPSAPMPIRSPRPAPIAAPAKTLGGTGGDDRTGCDAAGGLYCPRRRLRPAAGDRSQSRAGRQRATQAFGRWRRRQTAGEIGARDQAGADAPLGSAALEASRKGIGAAKARSQAARRRHPRRPQRRKTALRAPSQTRAKAEDGNAFGSARPRRSRRPRNAAARSHGRNRPRTLAPRRTQRRCAER